MTIDDFKLLSTLPEDYDYELFPQSNGDILVAGKQENHIIGFILNNGKLIPANFHSIEE